MAGSRITANLGYISAVVTCIKLNVGRYLTFNALDFQQHNILCFTVVQMLSCHCLVNLMLNPNSKSISLLRFTGLSSINYFHANGHYNDNT